jgi:hypothetical protein
MLEKECQSFPVSIFIFHPRLPNDSIQPQALTFWVFKNLPIPDKVITLLRATFADRNLKLEGCQKPFYLMMYC